MGDHGLYPLIGLVCCRVWRRQHAGSVKNIEALVFHGTHVEVFDGDNHIDVQVVLTAKALFIPSHRALQHIHGVVALRNIVGLRENLQFYLPATHGGEGVL